MDSLCQCGHPRSEHLEDDTEYFECTTEGCECEDFRLAEEEKHEGES